MSTADLYRAYTAAGTPETLRAYNGGITRHAVVVYSCYMRDPLYEREPTGAELRLIVDYCAYFIQAPCWVIPAAEIAILRRALLWVETPQELAGWLWGCSQNGIGPVLGVG